MTWFTTYGIKQDLKERMLVIPTNNGTQSVELYGENPHGVSAEFTVSNGVFSVNVRENQDLEGYDEVVITDGTTFSTTHVVMDYPTYVAVYQYLTHGTFPLDSNKAVKQRIRRMGVKYFAHEKKLFSRLEHHGGFDLELLHEGNIEGVVTRVHCEGHLGAVNTFHAVRRRYLAPGWLGISVGCHVVKYDKDEYDGS
ncbi:hypothetical protein BCR42DRAFT_491242 [Absidia repens]|uniref:Uncharacterized protein n=1 Tax=Absidia repens TaxID=90262 RepID=A0A1X2IJ26_9FUNG|nr:hypothetical protein BCR42DRAFT_491242 [Absidia repens]